MRIRTSIFSKRTYWVLCVILLVGIMIMCVVYLIEDRDVDISTEIISMLEDTITVVRNDTGSIPRLIIENEGKILKKTFALYDMHHRITPPLFIRGYSDKRTSFNPDEHNRIIDSVHSASPYIGRLSFTYYRNNMWIVWYRDLTVDTGFVYRILFYRIRNDVVMQRACYRTEYYIQDRSELIQAFKRKSLEIIED